MKKRMTFLLLVALGAVMLACGGTATPAPGALFGGSIDVGDRAGGGTIGFNIADDGTSISDLSVTLSDVDCDGLSLGYVRDVSSGQLVTIVDGQFSSPIPAMGAARMSESQNYHLDVAPSTFPVVEDMRSVGQIEGEFSSATQANGTITLWMAVIMTDRACELGTFTWSAMASP